LFLPAHCPAASGGDVLMHASPAGEPGSGRPSSKVQVWAVVAGSLVRIAGWDPADPDPWPETVRGTVTFAMGALTELEQHGADVSGRPEAGVTAAASRGRPGSRRCPPR
jgi:hypothetical protein